MNNATFDDAHFSSNDGMLTSVWGPCLWHSLHTISFNYPVEPSYADMVHFFNFFKSLKHVLPCGACRTNYLQNLDKLHFGLHCFNDRTTLSYFVYNLHELVNAHLGKTSNLSYNDVRHRFEHFRARCLVDPITIMPELSSNNAVTDPAVLSGSSVSKGCTEPMIGIKSKCVLSIVPLKKKCNTFNISKLCAIREKIAH